MTKTLIFKETGKYGLRNIQGKVLLLPKYEKIKYLNQERFAVVKDKLWAIIDSDGRFLTDFIYRKVENFYNDRAVVELNTEYISQKLINLAAEELDIEYKEDPIALNKRYQNISPTLTDDRYIAKFGKAYRLLDENGKFVDGGQAYKTLKSLNENLFLAKKFGKEVVLDNKHNIIFEVPEKYVDIYYQMSNGMYQVTTDTGMSGYLDAQGNEVIPAIYHGGYEFSVDSDLAFVMIDEEKGGYINSNNEFIIPPVYEFGNVFSNGIAGVLKEGIWFFINEKGEKISPDYAEISEFINDCAKVTLLDGRKVVVDTRGEVIFSYPEDTKIGYFENGLAPITQNKKVGLINLQGEIVIKPKYEEISVSKYTDIHTFKEKGLYGYITTGGKIIIDAIFDKANNFGKNGCAIVVEKNVPFLLENFGKTAIELDVDLTYQMTSSEFGDANEAAVMVDDDEYIFIDSKGNRVSPIYEMTTAFYNNQAFAIIPADYHIIDKFGRQVDTEGYTFTLESGELILNRKK